jgi:hypothetical protein
LSTSFFKFSKVFLCQLGGQRFSRSSLSKSAFLLIISCRRTFILYHHSFSLSTTFFQDLKVIMETWEPAFQPFRVSQIVFQFLVCAVGELLYYIIALFVCQHLFLSFRKFLCQLGGQRFDRSALS